MQTLIGVLLGFLIAGLIAFFVALLLAMRKLSEQFNSVAAVFGPLVSDGSIQQTLRAIARIAEVAPGLLTRFDGLTNVFEIFNKNFIDPRAASGGPVAPVNRGSDVYFYDEADQAAAEVANKAARWGNNVDHLRATPPTIARVVAQVEERPAPRPEVTDFAAPLKPKSEPSIQPPPPAPHAGEVTAEAPLVIDTTAP